ncbi:ABC-F family ATP-binding cassette domain-containing protein [Bacteroidota bacterium]
MINIIQAENISKSYGDLVLFEDISISISKNQKISMIAINGAGKTTILNILAGRDKADKGVVTKKNDLTIGYLEQDPVLNDHNTVLEEVFASSDEILQAIREYEEIVSSNNNDKLQEVMEKMDRLNAWGHEVKIKQILTRFKINEYDKLVGELSGGQKKRLALANVLINNHDLIILDEPTNHLDLDMIEWLEDYLLNTTSSIFMVTHDRYFLDRVCNEIIELDNNVIYTYKGNYTYFLTKRQERIVHSKGKIEKASNLLRKELDWVNRMPKARGTKAKYRLDAFRKLKEEASQKIDENVLSLDIVPRRLGKKILEIDNLNKSYDDLNLIKDFSYKIQKFEKIGIIGNNGSGKSTFLNIITGGVQQDSGSIEFGDSIVFGYFSQTGIITDYNKRVIDVVKDVSENISIGNGKRLSATQFLEYFLFPPKMHYSLVSKLSGGERRRLYLLTVLIKNPNFLIFDEPTNDLDIVTLNVLEEYLTSFKGCLIIVSHDRFFLDKIVDHIFVFGNNGIIKDFPGNYSVYRDHVNLLNEKKNNQSAIESKPKREKHKREDSTKKTFKEKTEFETLEKEMPELENEKKILEAEISAGQLTPNQLIEKSARLGKIIHELDIKELRWLELSEKN